MAGAAHAHSGSTQAAELVEDAIPRPPAPDSRPPRLGVFGGTFDPIHLGHLILAEQARAALRLDRVLFLPAGVPWRKSGRGVSAVADRVAMVQAAVAGDPYFECSLIEAERSGPTYTVDTLATLTEQFGADVELFFILGGDALADMPVWRDPAGIVRLARLVVAERDSRAPDPSPALEAAVRGVRDRIDRVPMPAIGVSSTDIRRRVAGGGSIRFLVPAPVAAYIDAHGLYRS